MARNGSGIEELSEWTRLRFAMALAYLEWVAATARLEKGVLAEIERVYPAVTGYAERGQPIRECSLTDLTTIAAQACLLIDQDDLSPHVKALETHRRAPAAERHFLAALLQRPVK